MDTCVRSWLIPPLTEAGSIAFWNRQAGTYNDAPMTNDNADELTAVSTVCDDYVDRESKLVDVVTFGGADGYRDPGAMLKHLANRGVRPSFIRFNDLSPMLAQVAHTGSLAPYNSESSRVVTMPGPIFSVAAQIPHEPRRVMLGLYRAEAFVNSDDVHTDDGFGGYCGNRAFLGPRFVVQWVTLEGDTYRIAGEEHRTEEACNDARARAYFLRTIPEAEACGYAAIRVVGFDPDRYGFFVSHWFTELGARRLLSAGFGSRADAARFVACRKGWVISIDPRQDPPRGIVSSLNNVIGNVVPQDQVQSLLEIDRMSA